MNPDSSAWMVYLPGGTLTRRYSPRSSVTAVITRPVAWSVAVTLTPGSAAFVSSTAVPMIVPCCAHAGDAHQQGHTEKIEGGSIARA